jgi:KaiC/GvpD/RAD55 family RecA-like ATPase
MRVEQIIAACMKQPQTLSSLRTAITTDLVVANPFYLQVCKFLSEFQMKFGKLPQRGDYELWIETRPDGQKKALHDSVQLLLKQNVDEFTPEFIGGELSVILREVATKTAISRMNAASPDYEALVTLTREVEKIQPLTVDDGVRIKDFKKWLHYKPEFQERVSTGIPKLDRYLGGGFDPGLVFVIAPPGTGKTIQLLNFGETAATFGKKVVHISFEVEVKQKLSHRYYRRITQQPGEMFERDPAAIEKQVAHWARYAQNDIHLFYRQAYTMTPDDLESFVELFVQKEGEIGMLVLDYLDLMIPSPVTRHLALPEQLTRMSHQIRNIGLDYGIPVVTAGQPKADAYDKPSLALNDLGSSRGKAEAADIVLTLNQTPEEASVRQARMGLLKVRESAGKNAEIPILIDPELMYIGDLDDPQTKMVIDPLLLFS